MQNTHADSSDDFGRRSGGNEPSGLWAPFLLIWRQRLLIVLVAILGVVGGVIYSFTLDPVFTAQVTLLPQENAVPSGLLGDLASMVGSGAGSGGSHENLYDRILLSDRIMDQALNRKWRHRGFPQEVSLFEIFSVPSGEGHHEAWRAFRLKQTLRDKVIRFRQDKGSGFMTLKVTVPGDGIFAADLANFLVQELDRFNQESRGHRAEEQYQFVKKRLEEVGTQLEASEKQMTDFKVRNRAYSDSPELQQRFNEISREVQAQTAVWVELRRQLEMAAIDVNKEKSSVDILDDARPASRQVGPQPSPFLGCRGICGPGSGAGIRARQVPVAGLPLVS